MSLQKMSSFGYLILQDSENSNSCADKPAFPIQISKCVHVWFLSLKENIQGSNSQSNFDCMNKESIRWSLLRKDN